MSGFMPSLPAVPEGRNKDRNALRLSVKSLHFDSAHCFQSRICGTYCTHYLVGLLDISLMAGRGLCQLSGSPEPDPEF